MPRYRRPAGHSKPDPTKPALTARVETEKERHARERWQKVGKANVAKRGRTGTA